MEYWVDGYNLILRNRWQEKEGSLERAREVLLRRLQSLRAEITVYFDASKMPPPPGLVQARAGHIVTIFVREGSADDRMANDLRGRARGKQVTIVTDDRELRLRAKQLKAKTLGVARFLERLAKAVSPAEAPRRKKRSANETTDRPQHLSKKEVDDWLDYMGVEEDWTPDDL
ncbi:MAG TPA: hypothetical protein ENK43_07400 [Planctomycetes bacterium]|nr:hypothetical protein [Planctomycetota bacterium]